MAIDALYPPAPAHVPAGITRLDSLLAYQEKLGGEWESTAADPGGQPPATAAPTGG